MIGIGFRVSVKKSAVLTKGQQRLALPLVELTQHLASIMVARIRRGQGPHGPWNTYGAGADDVDRLLWVAPGRPQPGEPGDKNGLVFRVESGRWQGWAVYASAEAYYRLRGLAGQPHDFEESGRLLRALAVRIVSPRQIRLAFYGGHKNLSAKQVAWLASRNEADPLLMPSPREVEEAQRFIATHINEAIIEGARLGAVAQQVTSRSRNFTRRASKLLGD